MSFHVTDCKQVSHSNRQSISETLIRVWHLAQQPWRYLQMLIDTTYWSCRLFLQASSSSPKHQSHIWIEYNQSKFCHVNTNNSKFCHVNINNQSFVMWIQTIKVLSCEYKQFKVFVKFSLWSWICECASYFISISCIVSSQNWRRKCKDRQCNGLGLKERAFASRKQPENFTQGQVSWWQDLGLRIVRWKI